MSTVKKFTKRISDEEAKHLVSYYYILQEDRKRFYNQERSADERNITKNTGDRSFLVELAERAAKVEQDIKKELDTYTKKHAIGQWIRSVYGLGPVLAAGILSNINIEKVHHAGSIWVYAGINAEAKWKKGEKRPWNQRLKNIAWKIGDSFNKFQNKEECYYGHILKERKIYEWKKNLGGEYQEQAKKAITEKKYSTETNAFQWYSGQYNSAVIDDKKVYAGVVLPDKECFPMLPPGHIMGRIFRYTAKRFFSDLYVVWYETHHKKKAPLPYVIVSPKFPEHTTYVEPFNYKSPYI